MNSHTVGELMDFLATQPRDRKVILRKDEEGNGHSPLNDAWESMYFAETTWSGETYPTAENIASSDGYYGDEDVAPEGSERVVVLGPVN